MLAVGLTGGIGCGKSTVAQRFADLGVPVIDADAIARELVEPGSPALAEIAEAFGADVIAADGSLDRQALRERAFAEAPARKRLDDILHPRVRRVVEERIAALGDAPYCLVVIPLMVESGMTDLVDRVLVVDCSEAQQVTRVTARDGTSAEAVQTIMGHQADRQTRLAVADDIIENTADMGGLERAVRDLHQRYLRLAQAEGPGKE